ncbi:hypothetical protein B0H14DRAFT_3877895, partial [Mycena olivaceomarginata]
MGLANSWPKLLKNLRVPNGPAPKRIADHQFYMHHPDFRAKITSEYAEIFSNTPKSECLKVRCQIARDFFDQESDEVKAHIRAEATAEHEQLLEVHNSAAEGFPSINEEERV